MYMIASGSAVTATALPCTVICEVWVVVPELLLDVLAALLLESSPPPPPHAAKRRTEANATA
ncbi:hypothetical protein [Ralstonia pseudosolanacearum]|uniref:hypothetical protein n=1 Tax=Ralstonia pseudosolanacearum TaxID=1310165 RepID=UPI001FFA6B1C|nr:hypothetical protein [Ralstonia pseudosolanacearum]